MRTFKCAVIIAVGIGLATSSAQAVVCIPANLLYGSPTVTAATLSFGTYIPSTLTPLTFPFTITVACTGGLFKGTLPAISIALSTGSGTFAQRHMTVGTSNLNYQLYTSTANTTVWGDATTGTAVVTGGNSTASSQTFTGGSSLTQGQWVKGGSYSDSVVISVSY